jgi:glucose/mannose-6-phosphate isomerase
MGGSAIGGMLLANYLETEIKLPIQVIRNYDLPSYINSSTLTVVCSYSGNTEETLSAYQEARKRNCFIVAITSGGKLLKMADADKQQIIVIPKGLQPRAAVPYFFFPLLQAFENARLISPQLKFVKETANHLRKEGFETIAKDLAEKIVDKTPIIYASSQFSSITYRWRTQFNENVKTLAINHEFPEMNHNELVGLEHPIGNYHIILLKSSLDHRRVQKKMLICEKIFRKTTATITVIHLKDTHLLAALFTALHIGDLTSYYLALRYRRDPSPVALIEELKREMGPFP